MKRRFVPTTICIFLLFLSATVLYAQNEQRRLALVIGNSNYADAPHLRNPVNDARAIAAKLKQLNFSVITVLNGSYRDMATSLNNFATKLNRYDVGLFYYSGHGVQYQGTNFLVPVDANIQRAVDIQFEALNATRVLADMQSAGTKMNIMILDACRNNPFDSQFRSFTRGLSVVQAPAGSLVVYSTAPDQVALDGNGENSPFTAALLHNIATPGVSVQDMLTNVFQDVQKETKGRQIPWESSSLTSSFYFAPKPPATVQQTAPVVAGSSPPQVASQAPSAGSTSQPEHGTIEVKINSLSTTSNTPVTHITFTGPGGTHVFKANTYSPNIFSLAPGHYRITASLGDDTSPGYQGEVTVSSGGKTELDISLEHSSAKPTRGRLVVNIDTLTSYTPVSRITLIGPDGTHLFKAQTYYSNTYSLVPGDYRIEASLGSDTNVDYEGRVTINSDKTTNIKIPLSFTPQYQLPILMKQRASDYTDLVNLRKARHTKGGQAAVLTVLGLAGAAVTYFAYTNGSSAYGSYEAATTAADAQTYRQQVTSDSVFTIAGAAAGITFLFGSLVTLTRLPPIHRLESLKSSIMALNSQIRRLSAKETGGQ